MSKLRFDSWTGVYANHEEISQPSWPQVERSIRRLDESQYTEASFSRDDGSYISVAGGNGRFLVYIGSAPADEEAYYTLADPEKPEKAMEQLVTGGQRSKLPARTVVGLETALRAARTFFDTGMRDPDLSWIDERAEYQGDQPP